MLLKQLHIVLTLICSAVCVVFLLLESLKAYQYLTAGTSLIDTHLLSLVLQILTPLCVALTCLIEIKSKDTTALSPKL